MLSQVKQETANKKAGAEVKNKIENNKQEGRESIIEIASQKNKETLKPKPSATPTTETMHQMVTFPPKEP